MVDGSKISHYILERQKTYYDVNDHDSGFVAY